MAEERYIGFSERLGYQSAFRCGLEDAPTHLRVATWNLAHRYLETKYSGGSASYPIKQFLVRMSGDKLWLASAHKSTDHHTQLKFVEQFVLHQSEWHEVYEFLESFPRWAILSSGSNWPAKVNNLLFTVGSPWRMTADGHLEPIASQEELTSLEYASKVSGKYELAAEHIRTAARHLGKRPDPDYDNTCKEAASALESAVLAGLGVQKAEFGTAIREFTDKYGIHPALKENANKLFGYANDREGVRHAAAGKGPPVDFDEAKFVLVSASAWVNYIAAKAP